MAINGLTDAVGRRRSAAGRPPTRPRLPSAVRIVGQVLLGVLAGARLDERSLHTLLAALAPVALAVVVLTGASLLLARYLFSRHGVDPLTAVMAATPGGISELAAVAEERGAAMHVVLAIHLLRVLLVVLVVLPIAVLVVGGT
jgi:membrane AbrB-like protein